MYRHFILAQAVVVAFLAVGAFASFMAKGAFKFGWDG